MEPFVHDPGFQAPEIGELRPLFPGFEIEGFLAQGGMGAVYAARQKSLDRAVAIKILPRAFGADAQFRASFESEAKTMARLNHPNLIGVYDFGEADGYLYIIMEMVAGDTLFQAAHGRVVDPVEVARLGAEICRGLAHAHHNGILHRDIKPENILLAPGPQPKIVDFGLARPAGLRPEAGEVIYGTPGYAAPEVLGNPAAVDQRADIFSAGVLLYELLTGQLPGVPWQPPSALAGGDARFDQIIRRATHPSPQMRYAEADEMAGDLESLAAKLEGPLGRRMAPPVGSQAAAARPANPGVARPGLPRRKSGAGSGILVAGLVIAVLAAVGFVVLNAMKDGGPGAGERGSTDPVAVPEPGTPDEGTPDSVVQVPDPPSEPEPEPTPLSGPPPSEPVVAPPESLAESLARLQPGLKAGDLTEMPAGTLRRGESRFLLVKERLRWREAIRFAERHGAQLAVFESPEDLQWASSELKPEAPVWIGLSDSGTEGKWHWVHGEPVGEGLWAPGQPDDSPSDDDGEDFAALLPGAVLNDLPGSLELAFVLQWSPGGGQAGTLAAQLERCGGLLQAKQAPVFPAGSRNIGGSRFLLVPDAVSWERASAVAQAAGGHLAVPSNDAEAAWLAELARHSLDVGQGCWVGGLRMPGASPAWGFVTGEQFDFVTWPAGQPDGPDDSPAYLQFQRSGEGGSFGYVDAAATDPAAACFVIEWSAPSRRNMTAKSGGTPANAEEWLLDHRERTAAQNQPDYKPFRQRWDKNVKDFVSGVESAAEGAGRFGRGMGDLAKTFISETEAAGRIPKSIPGFSEWIIGDLHREALEKQNELWTKFEPKFDEALGRYLEEIRLMAERLERIGKRDGAAYLTREITATTADPNRFHDILNGFAPPVPEE